MEAKDDFLEKAVLVVAIEGCAECEKGLLVKRAVVDPTESIEVEESPREWEK